VVVVVVVVVVVIKEEVVAVLVLERTGGFDCWLNNNKMSSLFFSLSSLSLSLSTYMIRAKYTLQTFLQKSDEEPHTPSILDFNKVSHSQNID